MIYNYCDCANFEYLLSETNSRYSYCGDSKSSFDLASKYVAIDAVLSRLLKLFNSSKEDSLKVEVKLEDGTMVCFVNGVRFFDIDFRYDFSNRDVCYLEGIISELVEDSCFDFDCVEIVVCK